MDRFENGAAETVCEIMSHIHDFNTNSRIECLSNQVFLQRAPNNPGVIKVE